MSKRNESGNARQPESQRTRGASFKKSNTKSSDARPTKWEKSGSSRSSGSDHREGSVDRGHEGSGRRGGNPEGRGREGASNRKYEGSSDRRQEGFGRRGENSTSRGREGSSDRKYEGSSDRGRESSGRRSESSTGRRREDSGRRGENLTSRGREGSLDRRYEGSSDRGREGSKGEGSAGRGREGTVERKYEGSSDRGRENSVDRGREEFYRSAKSAKAKKMTVRQPNQQAQERAHRLRDRRTDLGTMESVRLQKALAASGVGSRREMEDWINQGMVQVNGRVASLGDKVVPGDRVMVKGNQIKLKWPDRLPRILVYNKQEGEIVSRNDPKGRVSIFDRVTIANNSRWVAIGRLDVNTTGMLILTTSGELANRFAHPSFEVEREYSVRILGTLETEQMRKLTTEGVQLDDGIAKFLMIQSAGGEGANQWYRVVIKEGRNREVRRIFEHLGFAVSRLIRTRFGPVSLPSRLKRGQFYELNEIEVAEVLKWAKMPLPGDKKRRSH